MRKGGHRTTSSKIRAIGSVVSGAGSVHRILVARSVMRGGGKCQARPDRISGDDWLWSVEFDEEFGSDV